MLVKGATGVNGYFLVLQVLEERTNYLVLVLCDDVALEDLDEDMRRYVRTNTYWRRDDRLFWKKLRYHLPQRPLSEIQRELNLNRAENADYAEDNGNGNTHNHIHFNPGRAEGVV